MGNKVTLVKPTINLKKQYLEFYQEWKDSGEDMVPWVIEKDPSDFQAMLSFIENNSKGVNLPAGWVPDSTYWLVDAGQNVVGAVNIRHSLTEALLNAGGHIGYGIRPSARRKGFATKILALSLEKTKELGIDRVLVVCDKGNIGSEKTIIKNGGKPDEDFIEENGNVIKRYWIQNT
ncbi:GNAT family N-acetyltransferase [Bacillus sp. SG-1]|uniref:GNAT family N-acetyltransferase n=1 Tax=Bacillus sp. SG-1 TaxID=161544 RepID=UPI00015440D1|nr:GNAT family N-acetyltransferase [Bacillus sp. SG-1]EDL65944.1 acetyltransferase, GNAT family protein [Bacillus sp. SG-1]